MGTVRQISESRTGAFASNKHEKFGFYGVFCRQNTDCDCENPCVIFVYSSQKSMMLTDL